MFFFFIHFILGVLVSISKLPLLSHGAITQSLLNADNISMTTKNQESGNESTQPSFLASLVSIAFSEQAAGEAQKVRDICLLWVVAMTESLYLLGAAKLASLHCTNDFVLKAHIQVRAVRQWCQVYKYPTGEFNSQL